MECVGRAPAMRSRVRQGPEDLEELDERAGPAVRHHERQGVRLGGAGVQEVNVEVVDRAW